MTSMPLVPRPKTLFPLMRHLSVRCTPYLARLPVTANHITATSIVAGLGCGWVLAHPGWGWQLAGAGLLFVCYMLDNCDGEIAVLKDQCSEFGRRFDDFADAVVHAAFFIGLGIGNMRATGEDLWFWLGVIAAAGSTFNYFIVVAREIGARMRPPPEAVQQLAPSGPVRPEGAGQWALFIFRESFRADFCLIVIALALIGQTWWLLPAAAVGTQVYWVTHFCKAAQKFHS
jgi:phosphatidylglycerophosphate synthase